MNGAILVADTDESTQSIITTELSAQGFEIISARTNQECMTATIGKTIQLALISLDFPGMSDGSLSNLLHITSSPNLPIIGLASAQNSSTASGVTSVLPKPIDPARLKDCIAEMLQPESPTPPVNVNILMEASCDEQELAIELIHLFFDTTTESCEHLAQAVALGDATGISQAAHKCCGASASCGMLELERRMRAIEAMGKENRLDNVQAACDEMHQELTRCRRFLEAEFHITIK